LRWVIVYQELGTGQPEDGLYCGQVFPADGFRGEALLVPQMICPFRNFSRGDALNVLMPQIFFQGVQLLGEVFDRGFRLAVR
jgi:hypothetical protein